MKIPAEMKAAYSIYRKECRMSNIEPVVSDFLAGDFPNWMRACISASLVDQLAIPQPALTEIEQATDELEQAEYNLYVAACHAENVEPALADYLSGEIPDGVIDLMERQQNGEALAATAAA